MEINMGNASAKLDIDSALDLVSVSAILVFIWMEQHAKIVQNYQQNCS